MTRTREPASETLLASLPPSLKGSRLVSSLAVLSDVEIKVAEPDMPKGSVENV